MPGQKRVRVYDTAAPLQSKTHRQCKNNALKKGTGLFGSLDQGLYVNVLLTLQMLDGVATMKTSAEVKTRRYTVGLLKYIN